MHLLFWIVISTLTPHLASPSPFTILRLEINVEFKEIFESWLSLCSHHMWACATNVMNIGTRSDMLLTYTTSLSTHMRTYYFFNLHGCTVHVDNIKSFICPTDAHTNYSKIVELLKTFKTTIIAQTCFGLHKPSSGSSQSVLRKRYNIDFSVYMSLMKFSVLWLHMQQQHRKSH